MQSCKKGKQIQERCGDWTIGHSGIEDLNVEEKKSKGSWEGKERLRMKSL